MSARRIGALVMAAVFAAGLAACGDDDDDGDVALEAVDESSDEGSGSGNENESSDDESSEEESTEGDDSSSDDTALDDVFGSERCQDLFGALSGFASAFGGDEAEFDFGEFAAAFDELADDAPEIEEELGVIAEAYREFDAALGGEVDFSDPEIFSSEAFVEASEAFQSEEFNEATTAVSTFLEEECSAG